MVPLKEIALKAWKNPDAKFDADGYAEIDGHHVLKRDGMILVGQIAKHEPSGARALNIAAFSRPERMDEVEAASKGVLKRGRASENPGAIATAEFDLYDPSHPLDKMMKDSCPELPDRFFYFQNDQTQYRLKGPKKNRMPWRFHQEYAPKRLENTFRLAIIVGRKLGYNLVFPRTPFLSTPDRGTPVYDLGPRYWWNREAAIAVMDRKTEAKVPKEEIERILLSESNRFADALEAACAERNVGATYFLGGLLRNPKYGLREQQGYLVVHAARK
jgi:hypothetical protein